MDIQFDSGRDFVRKPRLADGTMRFGIFWPYHRSPVPSEMLLKRNPSVLDLDAHIRLAKAVEAAGVDFGLIADGYAPGSDAATEVEFQDPRANAILWPIPIFLNTRTLGLASTIHTSYVHPVLTARFAGYLDYLSGGRWGWNIVNGFRDAEARLFGFDKLPDHDASYDMADEYLSVVQQLWQGEPIDHQGKNFKVNGKLARPQPGSQPLLVSASSSPRGQQFAARYCDYLFTVVLGEEVWPQLRANLRKYAEEAGRAAPPEVLVMGDFLVRDRAGEAADLYDTIMSTRHAEAQKIWSNTKQPLHKGKVKEAEPLRLVGTTREVADTILSLRDRIGLSGLLLRMPLWDASEGERIGPVLDILEKEGVWKRPADRGHSW